MSEEVAKPKARSRLKTQIESVSTVAEIQSAIRQLPAREAWEVARQLRDYLDELWDDQFEADGRAGKLDALLQRARADYDSGRRVPLDEILGQP